MLVVNGFLVDIFQLNQYTPVIAIAVKNPLPVEQKFQGCEFLSGCFKHQRVYFILKNLVDQNLAVLEAKCYSLVAEACMRNHHTFKGDVADALVPAARVAHGFVHQLVRIRVR